MDTAEARSRAHTRLRFQDNAKLYELSVTIQDVIPFSDLEEANRLLYKAGTDADYAIVTDETIFHTQAGGQNSDVEKIQEDV